MGRPEHHMRARRAAASLVLAALATGCPLEPDASLSPVGEWEGSFVLDGEAHVARLVVDDEAVEARHCDAPQHSGWTCLPATLKVTGWRTATGHLAWCNAATCSAGSERGWGVTPLPATDQGAVDFRGRVRCNASMMEVLPGHAFDGVLLGGPHQNLQAEADLGVWCRDLPEAAGLLILDRAAP